MNYLWGTYPEALSTIAACARQVILIDVRRHRTFRLLPDPEVPCPPWRDGTQGRHRRVVVLHQGYAAAHSTRRPGMTHDTPDADVRRRAPGPTPIAHTRGTVKSYECTTSKINEHILLAGAGSNSSTPLSS
jgi:hypothetical protein